MLFVRFSLGMEHVEHVGKLIMLIFNLFLYSYNLLIQICQVLHFGFFQAEKSFNPLFEPAVNDNDAKGQHGQED